MPDQLRALEFFSGIGGLHYALEYALEKSGQVVAAFDINTIANEVYTHNFGIKPINKLIDRLTIKDISKYDVDCWLLSPPCQPYTAGGNRLDDKDNRANGLIHLIGLLEQLESKPKYLFVENVPNFETSDSRNK